MYLIKNDTNQLYKMKFLPNKKFAIEHLDAFIEEQILDYTRLRIYYHLLYLTEYYLNLIL